MSIELITENHGTELLNLFENTTNKLLIVSPFLGLKTCKELSRCIIDKEFKCNLITRFYREDFIQGANSLDGLLSLLNAGAQIRCLIDLHTKLYIFDDNCSIITSANYTYGGLYSNIELGVKIDSENEINIKCEEYFYDLWDRIENFNKSNNNKAIVTKEMIEEKRKTVNHAISTRNKQTKNMNNFKQGALLEKETSTDLIENIFIKNTEKNMQNNIGGWLKFDATSENRHDPNSNYFDRYNEFSRTRKFFPTRPVGIKPEDRLFLSLVSYDNIGIPTPVIMGRAFSKGFNSNNIVQPNTNGWENWMADYPFYIELYNIEIIDGPVKNGISLLDVYRQLQGKIYPSTFGMNYPFEKIRTHHYQKDKIRITKYAEEYLNEELEKKFKQYGKVIV